MQDQQRGPLSKVYQRAKNQIVDRIDAQELNVAINRRNIAADFPLPAKLLAVRRSRKNLELEITPFTEKSKLGGYGKKSN